ncbi:thioredoxin TrxA [Syntrophomonas erecta]
MVEVDKDNFEQEVISASGVVMVDWWGPKCERCMELMPHVEELAQKYGDKIKFCSVNTSGNRRLAIGQKVLGLPAILFYKNGEKIDEISGQEIMPEDIEEKIKKHAD